MPAHRAAVRIATRRPRCRDSWLPDWHKSLVWRLGGLFCCINAIYFSTNAFIPIYLTSAGRPDLISIRVAAASGGLWEFVFLIPIQMTDGIPSQCLSTFSTKPGDDQTIIAGTGEPFISAGRGLWKKAPGSDWVHKPLSPEPSSFFRIRYAPDGTTVHAATDTGYYRSTDGGETWTRTFTGWGTDLAIHPITPNVVYMTVWGSGLYKSTNAGLTWSQVTTPGIPTSGVTRGAVAIGAVPGPPKIYVVFANSSYFLQGVYRTSERDGDVWTNISPSTEYMWGQGWYDNMLGVSPTNNNIAIVGGGALLRTSNSGGTWTPQTSYPQLHVDYHAIYWHSDGNQVWLGHDGGWSYSADAGLSWDASGNYQPVTQFVNIYASAGDANVIGGGSQDNGMSLTTDGGVHWLYRHGGDGAGFAVDPANSRNVFAADGVYGGISVPTDSVDGLGRDLMIWTRESIRARCGIRECVMTVCRPCSSSRTPTTLCIAPRISGLAG